MKYTRSHLVVLFLFISLSGSGRFNTLLADDMGRIEQVFTQIPEEELSKMSTVQLIKEYINSFVSGYWFAYNYMEEAFNQARKDFNGLDELIERDDAPQELIEFYQEMDPTAYSEDWDLLSKGSYAFSFIYLEALIAQDCIRNKMTSSQIDIVLKELLDKYKFKCQQNNMYSLYCKQFNVYACAKYLELKKESNGKIQNICQMTDLNILLKTGRLPNINILTTVINAAQDYLKENEIINDDWTLGYNSLGKQVSTKGPILVDLYTPEGMFTEGNTSPVDMFYSQDSLEFIRIAQLWIDNWELNAEMILGPSFKYNCYGYAFWTSEGNDKVRVADLSEIDNFYTDNSYSNDNQPSYVSASEAEATHAVYTDKYHAVRKIQNSYPISVQEGRDYISKWGDMGLYQHAKDNDIYHEGNIGDTEYKILKTNHSGTLSNYPKTWVGAGVITHTISSTVTVPSGGSLKIKSGTTVEFTQGVNLVVNGTLIVESDVTFNIPSGSQLVISGTLNTGSNITILPGATLTVNSGSQLYFSNGKSLIINGTLSVVGTSASPITFDFTSPSSTHQNGIKFNSGSSGMLSYCNIKNAYHGVKCYSNLPTIQYCDIYNNGTGIYI
ncbi:MAG TPA: hypothetical protein PLF00_08045 [Candidatus Marinimicrobia bacterium]|nr:hypothetical protein [Candidatus Neomarinimicrobiota bacterium]